MLMGVSRIINVRRIIAVVFIITVTATLVSTVVAEPLRLNGFSGAFNIPVQSRKEMKWNNVVQQQYDFSCGAAAIATLLTYHYDHPTTEDRVFKIMFNKGNKQQIRTIGFSMLDMKLYLDALGLKSDGFRMTLEKFAKIGVPGITMINTKGYNHFVVVKGVKGNRVLVADPALGTRVIPREDFEQQWNGAILAARESIQIARQHFNETRDWQIHAKSPLSAGVDRSGLGSYSLSLPQGLHEFGR
ncbi:MAG: C39 family peptidase [Methylococcales bacterium]